jgi:phenylacetate-CoA ligase
MHSIIVNKIVFPLQEFVKRKPTFQYWDELERSQWLSPAELSQLQLRRLVEQLAFAYHQVPYYRGLFDKLGLKPEEIGSLRDFERIPFLEKEVIRSSRDDLQPKTRVLGTHKMSTGGSTGSPVTVFVDRSRAAFTDAVRMRAHRWFGVDVGAREIALWGSPIEMGRQDWLRNVRDRFVNSRFLAAFNMSEERMAEYGNFIQKYRPVKMYGYASAFYLLAEFLKGKNWRSPSELKVIFVTAEPLYEFQRRTIEDVFECAVAVEYGARDAGLMANECPNGGLHIPAEGMLIEIDSPDATGLGELVATNLFSNAMPIIRYRTGDMGRMLREPCPCGRALPRLESIEGRRTDFLMTPSGRVIHALAIIYPLRESPFVKQFQVVQETLDKVVLRVVPGAKLSSVERQKLMQNAKGALGGGIEIVIESVDEIPRLASGKYRYVVSNVADRYIKELSHSRVLSGAG